MKPTTSTVTQLDCTENRCPLTGLPLVTLPAFTDVEISPSYFVSLTRIGDSVLHSRARGHLKLFDYQRFMTLAEAFCDASGMRTPVVHLYDLFDVTGRMSFGGIKGITRYYVDHQNDIIGLVMMQQPSWLKPFIDQGYRLFRTPFRVISASSYGDAITAALTLLEQETAHRFEAPQISENRPLTLADVQFNPQWTYHNPNTGFRFRNGAIPGQLLFVSLHGKLTDADDIIKGFALSNTIVSENRLTNIPAILVDHSELEAITSLALRRLFAKEVERANTANNNRNAIHFIINPDRFNRIAMRLLVPFIDVQLRIVDTVEAAFEQITDLLRGVDTPKTPSHIQVSPQDLEEISNAFGQLQWIEEGKFPPVHVSSSNPLAYLAESLELVKRDIVEIRKQEQRAQEARFDESEAARIALLKEEEARRILLDHIPTQVWYLTDETTYGAVNRAHADFVGVAVADLAFHDLRDALPPAIADVIGASSRDVFATGTLQCTEEWVPHVSGDRRLLSIQKTPYRRGDGNVEYVVCSAEDITDRKRAEADREKLQAQLIQAQKMESVGRLAGGVAHDFNNMLSVILGNTEMLMEKLSPEDPLYGELEDIEQAASRSADLTRQLLAFARKQTILPRVVQLNDTLKGMLKMLGRLIGEDIALVFVPQTNPLWPVKVDPGQVDQILANLCVNARDAISGPGQVTIETKNFTFDDTYCADHMGAVPGDYVQLSISDDGCGIDAEMRAHLFEPFYTTKDQGQGTGLGLATVYGVVKQNQGYITVYSEPGQGTTFRIYLPRYVDGTDGVSVVPDVATAERGSETVLVVEDETAILKMTTQVLERLGYTVLTATGPEEAMRQADEHLGSIDLLLTDVIMPQMNGRDLATLLQSRCPGIRCLFMSGYTADVIAHHGVLEPEMHFIQKPFSMAELATALRKALSPNEDFA